MKSILFGNGINRSITGFPTWKDLLNNINPGIVSFNTTNILQYENIYGQAIDGGWYNAGKSTPEFLLKKDIAKRLRDNVWVKAALRNKVYNALATTNVEHFLTTNYEGYLLDIFTKSTTVTKSLNNTEQLYSIRRSYEINGGAKKYWPIHGEVRYPQTIMLGMDQYGGYLGKIDSLVKGNYDSLPALPSGVKGPNNIANRLANGLITPYSWVDLFFISDVHIIGLSLEYDEIDLWWLLTYRKRLKLKGVNITNRIVFHEPFTSAQDLKFKQDKHNMLRVLDVDIDSPKIASNGYANFYVNTISNI